MLDNGPHFSTVGHFVLIRFVCASWSSSELFTLTFNIIGGESLWVKSNCILHFSDRNLKAKTLSCLTSTPVLQSTSSQRDFLLDSPVENSVFSPNNEVFRTAESSFREEPPQISPGESEPLSPSERLTVQLQRILSTSSIAGAHQTFSSSAVGRPSPAATLGPPPPPRSVLSSEEIIPASPIQPVKWAVNLKRGKKELGGPALSLFKFDNGQVSRWKQPLIREEMAEEEESESPETQGVDSSRNLAAGPSAGSGPLHTSLLHPPGSARSVLSSDEIIPASPPGKVKSTVNFNRGKKEMGGPALSLFQFDNGHVSKWKQAPKIDALVEEESESQCSQGSAESNSSEKRDNRVSVSDSGSSLVVGPGDDGEASSCQRLDSASSTEDILPPTPQLFRSMSWSINLKNRPDTRLAMTGQYHGRRPANTSKSQHSVQQSISDSRLSVASTDSEHVPHEITVQIACVCGIHQETDSLLIGCDACLRFFHTTCVGLSKEDLAVLNSVEDDWFCPRCLLARADTSAQQDDASRSYDLRCRTEDNDASAESQGTGVITEDDYPVCIPETPAHDACTVAADTLDTLKKSEFPGRSADCQNIDSSIVRKCDEFSMINDESVLSDLEDECVMVKPGKNWRRSLSMCLMTSMNAGNRSALPVHHRRDTIADLFSNSLRHPPVAEFLAPLPPAPPTRRTSNRLSARMSAVFAQPRQSVLMPHNVIEEEEEEEEGAPVYIPVQSMEQSMRKMSLSVAAKQSSRASFMIVPGALGPPLPDNHATLHEVSLLLEPELSPLDKLAAKCWRQRIVAFSDVYPDEILSDSRKVGEGAFGEVYLMGLSGPDKPVLKIVPVGGDVKVNDGNQAGLTEMLSEVVISNTLSSLRNGAANSTQGKWRLVVKDFCWFI